MDVYGYNELVKGVYKPTQNWEGHFVRISAKMLGPFGDSNEVLTVSWTPPSEQWPAGK